MAGGAHHKWFVHMLQVGIEEKVVTPALIMAHVTPDILAHHLPPDVMSKILAAALTKGEMSAESLLDTLEPEVLVDNVPLGKVWECIEAGAERTGIAGDK